MYKIAVMDCDNIVNYRDPKSESQHLHPVTDQTVMESVAQTRRKGRARPNPPVPRGTGTTGLPLHGGLIPVNVSPRHRPGSPWYR